MSFMRVRVFVALFFLVAPAAATRREKCDHVGKLSMRANLIVEVKEGSASWMHDGGNMASSCEAWCKRKVENPTPEDKKCGLNKDQQCKWEDVCKWKGTKTTDPCKACPECGSMGELPKEPVDDLPKCEDWCAGKIGTQTCDGNSTLCTWSKICSWKGGKGSCSKCNECTAKCTLPDIASGVLIWRGPSCKSGGVVDAGTECKIVAAHSYICTSPGICDGGKFQKEGACKKNEQVEDESKCKNWCAWKTATTCKDTGAFCTWSEICKDHFCSKCKECTTTTLKSAGIHKQMSMLVFAGALAKAMLF